MTDGGLWVREEDQCPPHRAAVRVGGLLVHRASGMMAVWKRAGSAGGEDGGQDRVDSTRQGRAMAIGVLAHLAPMPTYNRILPAVRARA